MRRNTATVAAASGHDDQHEEERALHATRPYHRGSSCCVANRTMLGRGAALARPGPLPAPLRGSERAAVRHGRAAGFRRPRRPAARRAARSTGRARLLDLGSGPGTFAARAAARHPGSRSSPSSRAGRFARSVRALGEALPLATAASTSRSACRRSATSATARRAARAAAGGSAARDRRARSRGAGARGSRTTPTTSAARCSASRSARSSCAPRPPRRRSSPRARRRLDAARAARRRDPAGLHPGARMMRAWARRAAALHERADRARRPARSALVAVRRRRRAAVGAAPGVPALRRRARRRHVHWPRRAAARSDRARARAARTAIRELDGTLPDQPLAVTVRSAPNGAIAEPSALDTAAFAIGDALLVREPRRPCPARGRSRPRCAANRIRRCAAPGSGPVPFVCITLGDEPLATARHGHRRAWTSAGGPWLGLGRAGDLAIVSTCHLILDGYAHARLAARISGRCIVLSVRPSGKREERDMRPRLECAIPLDVTWRELTAASGRFHSPTHSAASCTRSPAGSDARFSPTVQMPVAPGAPDDPLRRRRRVVPAIVSVRFDRGVPEPLAEFTARARAALAREASGAGLTSMLLAAARATPAPLAWKRRALGVGRPRWLEPVADLIGGRGCVSRIVLDVPSPPACAVSSPAQLASRRRSVGRLRAHDRRRRHACSDHAVRIGTIRRPSPARSRTCAPAVRLPNANRGGAQLGDEGSWFRGVWRVFHTITVSRRRSAASRGRRTRAATPMTRRPCTLAKGTREDVSEAARAALIRRPAMRSARRPATPPTRRRAPAAAAARSTTTSPPSRTTSRRRSRSSCSRRNVLEERLASVLTAPVHHGLERILLNAAYIDRLISDLLDLGCHDAGRLEIRRRARRSRHPPRARARTRRLHPRSPARPAPDRAARDHHLRSDAHRARRVEPRRERAQARRPRRARHWCASRSSAGSRASPSSTTATA